MSHSSRKAPPFPATNSHKQNGVSSQKIANNNNNNNQNNNNNLIKECLWASDLPGLQKACYLARVCERIPPKECKYYDIAGIQQDGPTCGLTALSMLFNGLPAASDLLQLAKSKRYSYNGELFSANNLYQLICDIECEWSDAIGKNCDIHVISCELYKGLLDCEEIKKVLIDGACLLVPYDPDVNHAPCLRNGHKAHWALIVGYLISERDEFHVIARHGKAKNLAVWSLQSLSDSNANLFEFAQPKGYPDCDFVVPPGGIGGPLGLKERAIVINVSNHPRITVR